MSTRHELSPRVISRPLTCSSLSQCSGWTTHCSSLPVLPADLSHVALSPSAPSGPLTVALSQCSQRTTHCSSLPVLPADLSHVALSPSAPSGPLTVALSPSAPSRPLTCSSLPVLCGPAAGRRSPG